MPERSPDTMPAARGTSGRRHAGNSTAAIVPAAVRATTIVAVSLVAVVAGVVSYLHLHDLAVRAGEGWRSWLVPLAVDGLVVAASMTMVIRRRAGTTAGWLAWTSMTAGIMASLAANIAAAHPTLIGRTVAAWPPLALLLAYELLMGQVQTAHHDEPADQPPTETITPRTGRPDAPRQSQPTEEQETPTITTRDSAPRASIDVAILDAEDDTASATRHAARQRYRQTLASGLPCTGKDLADHFGMSERWGATKSTPPDEPPTPRTRHPPPVLNQTQQASHHRIRAGWATQTLSLTQRIPAHRMTRAGRDRAPDDDQPTNWLVREPLALRHDLLTEVLEIIGRTAICRQEARRLSSQVRQHREVP